MFRSFCIAVGDVKALAFRLNFVVLVLLSNALGLEI